MFESCMGNKSKHLVPVVTAILLLLGGCGQGLLVESEQVCSYQVKISTRSVPLLTINSCQFRDLNRNGALDPYEDWRLAPADRAKALLAMMTVAEKAGQLLHGNAIGDTPYGVPPNGYNEGMIAGAINGQHITSFISLLSLPPEDLAKANNKLQLLAENTRLAIPVVISSDPRHHFQETEGASISAEGFSQFPEPLGFAAIDETEVTRQFADIVRREYRAVGIAQALSPQADLATEPRWPRINGTFGEDATVATRMVAAYIAGIQGGNDGIGSKSVASVVKHWVGYGAAKEGLDAHNYYGRYADLSTDQLEYHIQPFTGAFNNQVAGVMPAYPIFKGLEIQGREIPEVATAFNRPMLKLLREEYGFNGIVLSDWAVTNDCGDICKYGFSADERPSFRGISTAWGVEDVPQAQRFALALDAGVDQFGGVLDATPLLAAFEQGLITEARIDESALRILTQTFTLGLFDAPFVYSDVAVALVGNDESTQLALKTQAQSSVLLKNSRDLLPLIPTKTKNVFLINAIDSRPFKSAGFTVVDSPEMADIAIVKLAAPYQTLYPNFFFGSIQHDGSLAFADDDQTLQAMRDISKQVPVVASIYLDRPAVLTPLRDISSAFLVNFGLSDQALVDVLTGKQKALGRLPFELPSSMAEVVKQRADTPSDTDNPLYPLGHNIHY